MAIYRFVFRAANLNARGFHDPLVDYKLEQKQTNKDVLKIFYFRSYFSGMTLAWTQLTYEYTFFFLNLSSEII